ncbi:MAG: hypothetical protein EHM55_12840 [Acidobacteria bacterium]|nr:MAG: hypothetical protein EHM55_12840 [Acidobacteriota bacterium]
MSSHPAEPAYVFPPALVRVVREHVTPMSGGLPDVTDDDLDQLLTTIFFAGLETYEGEHNAISVAFLGRSAVDFVMTEGAATEAAPLYRWKILRFASPRPFASRELVKLAVAGADQRIHSAVGVLDDGSLAIVGLAREGVNAGPDPFIRIVASRPGCLSIRSGRDLAIEYERGVTLTVGNQGLFAAGPVHRALAAIAHSAAVDDELVPRYLDAVVFLVRQMVAHGRGGIVIISPEEHPPVSESAPYRMVLDSSVAELLRLAWRVGGKGWPESASSRPRELQMKPSADVGVARPDRLAFGALLRNAFLMEAEQVVEELGRLTAIDGAVVLNRALALVAFGVVLPVLEQITIVEGTNVEGGSLQAIDFGSRGTRHRAGATYAAEHPGSVVFVASEDGQVSCLFRRSSEASVRLWRLAEGIAEPS